MSFRIVLGVLKLPPPPGFRSSSKSLELLPWVYSCSESFKLLEVLSGFLKDFPLRFWICSQEFGVAPRGGCS